MWHTIVLGHEPVFLDGAPARQPAAQASITRSLRGLEQQIRTLFWAISRGRMPLLVEARSTWPEVDERIGVDRLDAYGLQLAVEQARAVKGPEELELIRRSSRVCDAAVTGLCQALRPGMTENEAWAQLLGRGFELGAEFAECRLLSSGPRTNPWFREASDRRLERGDLVALDTDLIGPAGYLADLSRTYLVGSTKPSPRQRRLYADAQAFLADIISELKPGAALDEVGERLSRRPPAAYHAERCPFIAHSSGLGDEYPVIAFQDHHAGEIEGAMVLSVEAYVGVEVLSRAPHDEYLAFT